MGRKLLGDPALLSWVLIYTKLHAESWTDANLRSQGFSTLYPRIVTRTHHGPLFPRYLFVGFDGIEIPRALRGTYGVQRIVEFGGRPARVPLNVITDVAARMDEHGIVSLEEMQSADSLIAPRERERIRALIKLAQAGFRVRSA